MRCEKIDGKLMEIRMMLYWLLLASAVLFSIARCEHIESDMFVKEVARDCHFVPGLTRSQRKLCTQSPASVTAALQGLKMAVKECQHQMRWHRWNCSSLEAKHYNPHSAVMLQRGYRETAFAYAITAAGVAHSVARACAQGKLLACSCDHGSYRADHFPYIDEPLLQNYQNAQGTQATQQWKWGGCSHNIDFGTTFSKKFLDSREKAGDLHSNVNLHNNEIGRQTVINNMEKHCKCHGTSGSCQLKTCWKATKDFREIGKQLKKRYRYALMVDQSNANNAPPQVTRNNRKKNGKTRKSSWGSNRKNMWRKWNQADSLLFYERSPSFCEKDTALDVWGTSGRRCTRSRPPHARGSCSVLCCGRGHDQQRTITTQRCRCRFHWCCRVECDTCVEENWVSVCK